MKNALLCVVFAVFSCVLTVGQNFKVLHSFKGPPGDASYVVSRLVFDQQGNLYGTSANGGAASLGTVFKLSPNGDGTWAESVIYSLCSVSVDGLCLDGAVSWAGLILDSAGNLYGTTVEGGSGGGCGDQRNCGTVFELSPPAGKGNLWTETVLHNFCSDFSGGQCLDGYGSASPLIFDAAGNLYGTSSAGGSGHFPFGASGGTVFELSPGSGGWTQTVLYNFCSLGQSEACPDGNSPYLAGVTFDPFGNLYGTTQAGGNTKTEGGGVVYELMPDAGSGWSEKVLAAFPASVNSYSEPSGGVALDPVGNLYGTFELPRGGVFQLDPKTSKRRVFLFDGTDGDQPIGGVTLDPQHGVLYGTTAGGLAGNVFKIDAKGHETVLYNFCSQPNCADGQQPWATLVPDGKGNFYGTTEFGGEYGAGVVFEITP